MASTVTKAGASRVSGKTTLLTLAAGIVAAAVGAPLGLPAWALLLAAPLPWIIWAAARWGVTMAVVLVAPVSLVALLITLLVCPPLGLPGFWVVLVVWATAGVLGVRACMRDGVVPRLPSLVARAQWLGATTGALLWIAALIAAQFYPGASRLSWAMAGDSANNLLFAREVVYRGGLAYGPKADPVPLASALSSMVLESGRGLVSSADLTRHDVMAFAQTWAVLIALTCIAFGVLAGALVRSVSQSPLPVAVASAGASLLGLSWYVTGYPLEYGFFNAHLTFPLLACAVVAFLETEKRPALGVAALGFTSTAMLAVWTPLALVPLALGAMAVLRAWRQLFATRGIELAVGATAVALLVLYGCIVTLPTYIAQSGSLTAVGGAYPFRHKTVPALIAAALILAVGLSWKRSLSILTGTLAVSAAAAAGMLILINSSEDPDNPWGYYLLKYAWFIGVVLAVLVAGLAAAVVVRYLRQPLLRAAGFALVAFGTLAFVLWAPTSGNGYVAINPAERILSGGVYDDGDAVAERVFELSDLENAQLLWESSFEREGSVNFWLLQVWSNSMSSNFEVRYFAYGFYDPEQVESLCDIVDAMDAHVTVHTANPLLEQELRSACPLVDATVLVEDAA